MEKRYTLDARNADGERIAFVEGELDRIVSEALHVARENAPEGRSDLLTIELRPGDYKPRYDPPKPKTVQIVFRDSAPQVYENVSSVILNGDFFTLSQDSGEVMVRASEVITLRQKLPAPEAET